MGLRITPIGGRISAFHLTPTSPRRLPGVGGFLLAAPILFGLALHGGRQFLSWIIEKCPFQPHIERAETGRAGRGILWTIIIGFVAGVIARFLHPGNKYEPKGFILTTLLGIVGAFVATYLGQAVGWYQAGEGAGFIGAIVGAIIVLVVWGMIAPRLERT
jgi:uncharacterized membrane protein YeaQ/YmgE (transglycosylase-associated protein family)